MMKMFVRNLFITAFCTVASAQCRAGPSSGASLGNQPLPTQIVKQNSLPPFLQNNPLPHGYPWGNIDPKHDGSKHMPHTGVTRYYDFTISRGQAAPDGYLKEVILANNQFPGPLIEANWGDHIQVTVHNNITGPEEGTSLHWHGLLQRETPWMDGVPSISQCPIAPGSTFTYRFRADSYGTSWYHSHYSAQYLGGLSGPMIIYGPSHAQFDEDLGPILLQDYYHSPYFLLIQEVMSTNATLQIQYSDNVLINGRNPFPCNTKPANGSVAPPPSTCADNAPYSKFRVQSGKTYKLRLINTGAGSNMYFSIDNHHLTVITNDFVAVQPYNTTTVTLGTGQRSDVLFTPKGNQTVWMRSISSGKYCGAGRSLNPKAKAIVYLDNAPESAVPTTTAWPNPIDDLLCANDPLDQTIPYYPIPLSTPSVTYNITINVGLNATGHKQFTMNSVPFYGDYNDPILLRAVSANTSSSPTYDPKWNVVPFNTNTSIRINVWNNNTNPHPMHLHGHDFWVLHDGAGQWDGVSIIRPENPQRRDTHNLAPNGHMVIQYDADNPGTWPFHCHIAWHLSQGLFMTFVERPEEIKKLEVPLVMRQTCDDWERWTSRNVVEQIDSGLRRREGQGKERVVRKSLKGSL